MVDNNPEIITIKQLLTNGELQIPNYQRPYKWTTKNVNQLLDDILVHKDKSEYRLGTLVVHKDRDKNVFNIVDGQQRAITLTLIALAITKKANKTVEEEKVLKDFKIELLGLSFDNKISKANIQNNYQQITRRIADFDEKIILFFLEKCTLVKVVLDDISEAFQFFDSQNARGKDLEPHDLLKAFHLREMNDASTEEERRKIIEQWENIDTETLANLFSQYLFRIRNWSKGYSARYFSKNEIDCFKGVTPNIKENYPFATMLRITHFYVEEYSHSFHGDIDKQTMNFPFQLDGTIINGKRFFEMVVYYQQMIDNVTSEEMREKYPILKIINTYKGKSRTGDKYVRNLFYCGLIYYIDKFGEQDLSKAIDKIFVWAYSLRLKLIAVRLDSVDNYALHRGHSQVQLFKKIRESISPSDVLNLQLDVVTGKKPTNPEAIINKFKELNYYEEQ